MPVQDPGGLCSSCLHAKSLKTKGGSTLYLCQVSAQDPSFPKFPRLPVRSCTAYAENWKKFAR